MKSVCPIAAGLLGFSLTNSAASVCRLKQLFEDLDLDTALMRMLVERGAAETGDHLDVAFQVDGYTTTKALVAAGYTVLPYSAVRQEVGAGALSAVRIHRPALAAWTLSAAYRKDQGQARAVTALRNIIAAAVDKLATDGFWSELAGTGGQRRNAKRSRSI